MQLRGTSNTPLSSILNTIILFPPLSKSNWNNRVLFHIPHSLCFYDKKKERKKSETCRRRPIQSSSGHSSLIMRPVSWRENGKGSFLLVHVTWSERFPGPYLFINPSQWMLLSLHIFLATLSCDSH
ncbi:hypothetical protein NPIL_436751 [Nephila pilipes]|uniref:Uncharacterized protein n=1 Tax=Nephila pilipes TaxID=299642 RepID=A0A8X6NCC1_NEPPI|nr:hypothetical protein NPIL_436751 [Nephila pilipes]